MTSPELPAERSLFQFSMGSLLAVVTLAALALNQLRDPDWLRFAWQGLGIWYGLGIVGSGMLAIGGAWYVAVRGPAFLAAFLPLTLVPLLLGCMGAFDVGPIHGTEDGVKASEIGRVISLALVAPYVGLGFTMIAYCITAAALVWRVVREGS